jgi:hypothetical protein
MGLEGEVEGEPELSYSDNREFQRDASQPAQRQNVIMITIC